MEENIQIQPIQPTSLPEVRKKPKWIWFVIIGACLVAGLFLLKGLGGLFISEVVQDLNVEESQKEVSKTEERAIYFELDDIYGNKVKLSDFLGKPLVLTFWTTWNTEAVDQLRIIDADLLKEKGDVFEVVTINSQEDSSTVSNFVKRGGYTVIVLLDINGAVSSLYEARSLPTTYFIDETGIIREIYIGILGSQDIVDKISKVLSR